MRVADIHLGNTAYRSQTRKCEVPECDQSTREGKPYCSEHVGKNSYAAKVLADIARRDAEDTFVLNPRTKVKDYPIDGVTARAIVQNVRENGTRTKERLCRELNIEKKLLDAYSKALIRSGVLRLGRTGRGSETLSLR